MSDSFSRLTLWFAALVFGAHIGAAVYEVIVVTPLWADNAPQSVRNFNPVAEFAVRPLSYKVPAIVVLAFASLSVMSVAIGRPEGKIWGLLAGLLGLAIAIASIAHAVPILQRTIVENGASLTDAQIIEHVHAWVLWSRLRLIALLLAWIATVASLLRRSAPRRTLFGSDLRWK
jgi:hypothetical protein